MIKNKIDGPLFLGLMLSAISPIIAALSTLGYLISSLREKWSLIAVFFITNVVIFLAIKSFVQGDTLNSLLSNANKGFTLVFLLIFSKTLHQGLCRAIVSLALLTVPVSIIASLLSSRGYFLLEGARTSMVGGFDRLFYPFFEPSHYAIFLALSSIIAIAHKSWLPFSVLILGLVLTWSLSGWIIFASLLSLFFYFRFSLSSGAAKLNWFLLSVPFTLIALSVFIWLISESPWLSFKVGQIVGVINGESSLSSAFVRFHSAFLGWEFLKESFQEADILGLFLGMSPEDSRFWIKDFYLRNYGLDALPSSFNAISSMILNFGLVGLGCILFVVFFFSKENFVENKSACFLVYFVVAIFHGYAFGFLAIFYFVLSMVCAKEISR